MCFVSHQGVLLSRVTAMNEMHTISSHRILNLESDRLSCSTVPSKIPCAILILFDHFFLAMKKRATALSLHRPVVERIPAKGQTLTRPPGLAPDPGRQC